jgi:hypothetical protein
VNRLERQARILLFSKDRLAGTIPIILSFIFFLSCESLTPGSQPKISAAHWILEHKGPVTVAILPFQNQTQEEGLEEVVRKSFYNNFSSKNYHDIELDHVDQILNSYRHSYREKSSREWNRLSPYLLGEILQADIIIYGKIKDFKKHYMGIYSQISLELEIKMVRCATGRVLWEDSTLKRSHDGGLPFTFLDIIPAAIRSTLHMNKEGTVELIDRFNRELVEHIPDPPRTSLSSYQIDVQVASFMSESRALKTVEELKDKDLRARIERFELRGYVWHRVLIGPFYLLSDAQKTRKRVLESSRFRPILIRYDPHARKKVMKGVPK